MALLGVVIDGISTALGNAALFSGFHAQQDTTERMFRWTDGNARLVPPVGAATVTFDIGGHVWKRNQMWLAAKVLHLPATKRGRVGH